MNNDELQYYSRQIILNEIGIDGQNKLKNSSVLVIGAGGLGCPILQQLAAIGIGRIGIVDFDKISASNLHRQTLYKYSDIGKWKCEVAKTFISEMNPFIHIETQRLIICENNVLDIIKGYDIIVDCTDNPLSKYLINDACVVKNKPLVYGSVFKFEGNVSVFNHHENAPTLRCLFPEINDEAPDCNRTGTIGIVTAITGLYMANEVLKIILESKYLLEGKLLIFNGLTSDISIINFNANPYARQISIENLKAAQSPTTLSPTQLKSLIDSKIEFQLLDVRTEKEHQFCNIGGILVPLDEFEEKINILNPNIKTIVYCHHGIRSRHAMDFLKDAAFKDVLHLEGGIHAWSVDVDESIPVY